MNIACNMSNSDRLFGKPGHLSDEQDTALINLKVLLAENDLYKSELIVNEKVAMPASHDDACLLRFLRANRFDAEAAFRQFQTTENWRKKSSIDEIYNKFDTDEFEETRKYVCG